MKQYSCSRPPHIPLLILEIMFMTTTNVFPCSTVNVIVLHAAAALLCGQQIILTDPQ